MKAVWKYKSYGAPMGLGFFYEVSSEFGRWIVHAIPSINFRSRTLLISLDKRPKRTDKGKIVSDENAKDLRVFTIQYNTILAPSEGLTNRRREGQTDRRTGRRTFSPRTFSPQSAVKFTFTSTLGKAEEYSQWYWY